MTENAITVGYSEMSAVHDHMAKILHVSGICTVRGGGVAVGLEPREGAPAFNPQMLMLTVRAAVTGESSSKQILEYRQDWPVDGPTYTEVGFVVEGIDIAPPPQLPIEDVY